MKKVIAREFLWLLFAVVLAFPLGFVFLHILEVSTNSERYPSLEEQTFVVQLYFLGVILSFIGVYLVRLIVAALRTVVAPS